MSGTSMDGIDISLIKTNGKKIIRQGKNFYLNYELSTKLALAKIQNQPLSEKSLDVINEIITEEYTKALILSNFVQMAEIIGIHGQTILHIPKKKSIQIGDPKKLFKKFKRKIVSDFRLNDIKNHGDGAPISPIYHKNLINELSMPLPSCFINIGGISNITYWDGQNLLGFDTGPGNNLIDHMMKKYTTKEYDENGKLANLGRVKKPIVKKVMNDIFFKTPPPKSLDKNHFVNYFDYIDNSALKLNDKIATLAEISILSIVNSLDLMPKKIKSFCIAGGGYKNNYILKKLKNLIDAKFYDLNSYHICPDFIEAEMIAYLAVRRINNLPSTFETTTGARKPTICGEITFS